MPAKDLYHDTIVQALIKDGWEITDRKARRRANGFRHGDKSEATLVAVKRLRG
ncbi:MAG: element excision factor XisH family protein [Nostoc sp.]